jgi:hypothetical protein
MSGQSFTLRSMLQPGAMVQVRCHPNCPWLVDFVVTAVFVDVGRGSTDGVQYEVQRVGHARPLPAPLPESDVRAELAIAV